MAAREGVQAKVTREGLEGRQDSEISRILRCRLHSSTSTIYAIVEEDVL